MKNLEEVHGYKTLKSTYEESLSDENGTENEEKDDTPENKAETQEVNKMKRDIITLKAEMKVRKDK